MAFDSVGHGTCNGSFGEILQGVLPNGRKFLVNLPITLESRATVRLLPPTYDREKEERFADAYRRWPKAHKAVFRYMGLYVEPYTFDLMIDSDIPQGKGLSSSTADMVAAIRAVASVETADVDPFCIDHVLRAIEPNDGLHYPGTAVYAHEEGQLIAQYDYVPHWLILGVDEGGAVDTVEFNRQPRQWDCETKEQWARRLETAKRSLEGRRDDALAAVCTNSTMIWQRYHPKGHYEQIDQFCRETDGLGLVNCHSGTYLGVIYPPDIDMAPLVEEAQRRMPECDVRVFETKGTP